MHECLINDLLYKKRIFDLFEFRKSFFKRFEMDSQQSSEQDSLSSFPSRVGNGEETLSGHYDLYTNGGYRNGTASTRNGYHHEEDEENGAVEDEEDDDEEEEISPAELIGKLQQVMFRQ